MADMSVNIAGVTLKNPVMTASGTFGSGMEYSEFVDLSRLGAVAQSESGCRILSDATDRELWHRDWKDPARLPEL